VASPVGSPRLEEVAEVASEAVAGIIQWSVGSELGVKLGASAGAMFAVRNVSMTLLHPKS
jgi:hypothetical protein